MFNTFFIGLAALACVILFVYLAISGWQDMKNHETK